MKRGFQNVYLHVAKYTDSVIHADDNKTSAQDLSRTKIGQRLLGGEESERRSRSWLQQVRGLDAR